MDTGGQGTPMIVVDTNIVVESLLLPNGHVAAIAKENTLIAPDFLLLEVGNVLRKYHHFSNLHADDVMEYMVITQDMVRHWIPDKMLLNRAMDLCIDLNHAIYDCLFLTLSELYAIPFWTLDKKLKVKAESMGLKTFDSIENE